MSLLRLLTKPQPSPATGPSSPTPPATGRQPLGLLRMLTKGSPPIAAPTIRAMPEAPRDLVTEKERILAARAAGEAAFLATKNPEPAKDPAYMELLHTVPLTQEEARHV